MAGVAVDDMTSDVSGGQVSMDFILEGAAQGVVWKLSPDEGLLVGANSEAPDETFFDSVQRLNLALHGSSPNVDSCFKTSREPKETVNSRSVTTASGIDACCEENSLVTETLTIVSSNSTSPLLASLSYSKPAPPVSGKYSDGSTPSEHTTSSPPPAPTIPSDSAMEYFLLSDILPSESAELNGSEAGLLHMRENDHSLEMEQSFPSDCSSVGLTPFSSCSSKMGVNSSITSYLIETLSLHKNVPSTEENFARESERALLLYDSRTWSETEQQLLRWDHSPYLWPEMRGFLNDVGDGMEEYYHHQNNAHSFSLLFVPMPSLYPDVRVCRNSDDVSLISSSGSANPDGSRHGEGIQEAGNLHRIDWAYEKDCILSKMLGKRTASTAPGPLHEELLHILQHYENGVRTSDRSGGRTLRCFQRRITLITNQYCTRHNRRVRYLPDFCKDVLREWVEIDAHQRNPYPEKEEISHLADELGLTRTQVEQWFENYRVRSWNPQQNGMRKGKFFRYPIERTAMLKHWILDHKDDPNPKGKDLDRLMENTGMTPAQVKQWCYNFRKRHKSEML